MQVDNDLDQFMGEVDEMDEMDIDLVSKPKSIIICITHSHYIGDSCQGRP